MRFDSTTTNPFRENRRGPKSLWPILLIFWILLSACAQETPAAPLPEAPPVTLTFIGTSETHYELDRKIIDRFVEETGINVEVVIGLESATERLNHQYLPLLEAQSNQVDVYMIDVIWPGILAEHMIDLNEYLAEEAASHFPAIIDNNTVAGRLVGMPFFTDAGLLYYRTDLLEKYGYAGPPETWEALEEMAATIQAGERADRKPGFWGYVWQGAAYEGLTCDALEWQASFGGGHIIDRQGVITVNNPQTILAFEKAAGWIDVISPPGVTGFQEEDARSVWQVGNAAFMRNWPYAYALSQADDSIIKDDFAVTHLPSGGAGHASVLGGWQLSVSRYSDHPEEAVRFVKYMTGPEAQSQRAVEGAFLPTIPALYDRPPLLEVNPHYADLKEIVAGGAIARPSTVTGAMYDKVSTLYFTTVHAILTGEMDAAAAVANLETDLQQLTNFEIADP